MAAGAASTVNSKKKSVQRDSRKAARTGVKAPAPSRRVKRGGNTGGVKAAPVARRKRSPSRAQRKGPQTKRDNSGLDSARPLQLAPGRSRAPEIMVTLNNEHRYIASILEALAEQADRLLPGGAPDYPMMYDIVHYMASYPDEYHHPREDLVFDRLINRDADSREIVQQLLAGHVEISRRSKELLVELQRITRGSKSPDNRKLKYLCDRYIGYYWDHVNTEEGRVFPRATSKLRQEDWYAINEQARYVDDPLFGTRVRREYRELSQYLSERMARVSEDVAIAELFGIEALIETVATVSELLGEIRGIVAHRVGQSFNETTHLSREGMRQRDFAAFSALPGSIVSTICEQFSVGAHETQDAVSRARKSLAEPFSVRLQYLRKLMQNG